MSGLLVGAPSGAGLAAEMVGFVPAFLVSGRFLVFSHAGRDRWAARARLLFAQRP
jgi:hypothetical protein